MSQTTATTPPFEYDPNELYAPTLARDLIALAASELGVLTESTTVYVDSLLGDDSNAGTAAAPLRTLARAFEQRSGYIVRDATYTIQLIGAGPYSVPTVNGGWATQGRGATIVRGDFTARVVHLSSAFAGSFGSTPVIDTLPGLGDDVQAGRFIRVTSGAANQYVFQVCENTDASISMVGRGSEEITAGDTFELYSPGTVLEPDPASPYGWSLFTNIGSGDVFTGRSGLIFEHVEFTHWLLVDLCAVTLVAVKCSRGFACEDSWLATGIAEAPEGLPTKAYAAAGLWTEMLSCWGYGYLAIGGVFGATNFSNTTYALMQGGWRFRGTVLVEDQACLAAYNQSGATCRFDATALAQDGGILITGSGSVYGIAKMVVTSGDCFAACRGGMILIETVNAHFQGGTTDPAGYAINVTGGGKCFTVNQPTFTGGTPGKDLKTSTNGGVPNSTLNAVSTAAGTPTDALLGEVLARVEARGRPARERPAGIRGLLSSLDIRRPVPSVATLSLLERARRLSVGIR